MFCMEIIFEAIHKLLKRPQIIVTCSLCQKARNTRPHESFQNEQVWIRQHRKYPELEYKTSGARTEGRQSKSRRTGQHRRN